VYGETRKEVADKLKELHRDMAEGQIVTDRRTVGQWLDSWIVTYVEPRKRPKTVDSYRQVVGLYLKPHLGRLIMTKLNGEHVDTMVNAMLATPKDPKKPDGPKLSKRTAQYARAVLRKALNQAKRLGYVRRNAVLDSEPVKVPKYQPTVLGPQQSSRLLQQATGERLEALWYVALGCGLREGELLGLTWEHINFQSHALTVAQALQRQKQPEGKSKLVIVTTKGDRVRVLPLPLFVEHALARHWERQQKEREDAGKGWIETGLVFTTPHGTPIDPRNLLRMFKELLEAAGLPDMRLHDLRHSCGTLLIAKGVHPRVVMDVLGHSQISITMNTYGHVLPEAQRTAATAMDGLFLEAPRDENSQ
jgi:integrase